MKKQILISFASALGVVLYITLIAVFLSNASSIFGEKDKFLAPVLMLTLFVLSAALTGLMVLGKPVTMYLDGMRKEAFKLLFFTLGWLGVLAVVVALLMIFI